MRSTTDFHGGGNRRNPRCAALILFFTLVSLILPGPVRSYGIGQNRLDISLPDMGDSSGTVLSATDAQQLGEAFMRQIRMEISVIDEPEVSAYLNTLGYRLASHSGGQNRDSGVPNVRFTFFGVKDSAINAFAVPGGFIGINAGLILATESEGDLAAVLAHEIAHIRQRHVARSIQLSEKMHPLTTAGMLVALAIGSQNSEAGQAAMAAVSAGGVQKQIDFTRANEKEADRLGILTLAAAGFDPRAMPNFFERLQTAHRYYSEPPEFLSTHPVTVSRIADSRNRAEQYPYRQYSDTLEYHLVRAHLAVMMEKDPQKSVRYFDDVLRNGKYRNRTSARYGLALASMAAGNWKRARTELRKLLKEKPDHVTFQARLAGVELAAGRIREAIRLHGDALILYPENRLLTLGYARALLEGNEPEKVIGLLDRREEGLIRDSALQKLLARAFSQVGRQAQANAALAEHYYLEGHLNSAIRQLRMALKLPNQDYYQSSRIEARLRQFEEERRRLRRE
uniref:Putative beta-barrel assembly-enhancing protease n=1 Tax=Candidatus Kentrum sp. FM TaxID=2126340 RepID=A0A450S0B9_9GAMM|nr:MAG: Putative Zn-dependent protease, contains TPR repeats [Candidatus Kentron sp. FM]VFJ45306.1 MAG: Putative Zn-dependent protease, contains TPR repeats [Candidatus Kentron sp. FM]VFK05816.1 MAG: Putative Zn-dependent protease, contains TPR repeats [Candidatus Kentron sp. FM]